jgi:hypothetical protein
MLLDTFDGHRLSVIGRAMRDGSVRVSSEILPGVLLLRGCCAAAVQPLQRA